MMDISSVICSPYLGSAFLGCWLTDPLNHYLGRRGTLFFCGIFCIVSVIGSGFCQTWPQLLVCASFFAFSPVLTSFKVCRLLLGLGMGPKASTSPVFAAENTPASIRGGLVMSWQMWVSISKSYAGALLLIYVCPPDRIRHHARFQCQSRTTGSR